LSTLTLNSELTSTPYIIKSTGYRSTIFIWSCIIG